MLDRTIPFYNMILRCGNDQPWQIKLPNGWKITAYKKGFEIDWARLACGAGDFPSTGDAVSYFMERYPNRGRDSDILFLLNDRGQVIGSCTAWADKRQNRFVNSLHWLVVDEAYQGHGFGRALCCEAMNRFYRQNQKEVYLHTQPWSWKAVLLYISLGFKLQKTDTFSAYVNQYDEAMQVLKGILLPEQYRLLELASDEKEAPL